MKASGCLVVFLIAMVLFGVLYVAAHAYVYRGCLFTPNLFAWPQVCI